MSQRKDRQLDSFVLQETAVADVFFEKGFEIRITYVLPCCRFSVCYSEKSAPLFIISIPKDGTCIIVANLLAKKVKYSSAT